MPFERLAGLYRELVARMEENKEIQENMKPFPRVELELEMLKLNQRHELARKFYLESKLDLILEELVLAFPNVILDINDNIYLDPHKPDDAQPVMRIEVIFRQDRVGKTFTLIELFPNRSMSIGVKGKKILGPSDWEPVGRLAYFVEEACLHPFSFDFDDPDQIGK